MKRRTILMLVLVCGLPIIAVAEQPLARRVPAGSLLYVGWAGRNLPFDGSMLGQMLKEPATGDLLGAIYQAARTNLPPDVQPLFTSGWQLADTLWQRPLALVVLDWNPRREGPWPSAALLADLPEEHERFDRDLKQVVQAFTGGEPPEQRTVGGVTFETFTGPEGMVVSYGKIGTLFFAALGENTPARLIGLTEGDALQADQRFAEAFEPLSGDAEQLSYFVDLTGVRERITMLTDEGTNGAAGEGRRPGIKTMIAAAGLEKTEMLAGSVRIVDRGLYSKAKLYSPSPHEGLLMPFAGPSVTEADLSGVPADTVYFAAMKLSPSAVLAEVRRAAAQIDPETLDSLDQALARQSDRMGLSIEDDLLASLGDTWRVVSAPSYGGLGTGTMLTVQAADPEKLTRALTRIEDWLAREVREGGGPLLATSTLSGGRSEIHCLTFTEPVPLVPSWTVDRGQLRVALWPQVIQGALAGSNGATLTGQPDFADARRRVSDRPTAFTYVDSPGVLRMIYPQLLIVGAMGSNALRQVGIQPKVTWPPALPTMEKYVGPEVSAVHADAEGIVFESYGTGVSLAPVTPFTAGLAASVLVPSIAKSRAHASRAKSMAAVNGLLKAILLYQSSHDDEYPPDLAALVQEDIIDPGLLVSPLHPHAPPRLMDGELVGEVGYEYIRPATPAEDARARLVIYDKVPTTDGWIVGFADGHVEFVPNARFEQLLREAQSADEAEAVPAG